MNQPIVLLEIAPSLKAYYFGKAYDNSQVKRRMRRYIESGKLNIPIIRAYRIYLDNIDLELPGKVGLLGGVKVNVD